jgi:hypothetical protein
MNFNFLFVNNQMKKYRRALTFLIFIFSFLLFFQEASAATTLLLDSFSGTVIDINKWTEYDSVAGGTGGLTGNIKQNEDLIIKGNSATAWGTNGVESKNIFNRSAGLVLQADFSADVVTTSTNEYAIPIGFGNTININDAAADNLYIRVNMLTNRFNIFRGGANAATPSSKYPTFDLIPGNRYRVIMTPGLVSGATFQLFNLTADPTMTTDLLLAGSMNVVTGGSFTSGYVFSTTKSTNVTTTLYDVNLTTANNVPGAPTDLSATPLSNQANLSWTTPVMNGGVAVIDYLVEYKLSSEPTVWTTFVDGVSTSTSAIITGLTNDLNYDFRVSAVNAVGVGTASNIASTTPELGVPSVPLSLSASNTTDNRVDLSWNVPSSSGASFITDYLIEYKLASEPTNWTTFDDGISANTTANVMGLTNGLSYDFRVYAINARGASNPSSVITRNSISMTPTAPIASAVVISGRTFITETLIGSYGYIDSNADLEGTSTYRWLSATTAEGTYSPISGATSSRYVISQSDLNKYIKFEVTPVSNTSPATGSPVLSSAIGPVTQADYLYHILSTGQSLSLGYEGAPSLSGTQPYDNKMLNGSNALSSLIESGLESPASAMGNGITALNGKQVAVTKHGMGNKGYADLKKGTSYYNTGISQVSFVKSGAEAISKTEKVIAVTAVHGENDHIAGNAASYEGYLVEWQNDYEADIQAITGQNDTVPLFTDQIGSWTQYGSATSGIPSAQLSAAENNPDKIVLIGPKYFLNYSSSSPHLINTSYRWLGEYYAKVIKKVVFDGETWKPLSPGTIERNGNIIYAKFHVPAGSLVFDTNLVSENTNYGFEYFDNSSSATISSVELVNADTVKITLNTTPTGTNQRLRYAYTGTPNADAGAQPAGSPRGNLRDTDPAISLSGNNLYNWSVHFDKTISVGSSAPVSLSYITPNVYTKNTAIASLSPTVTGIPTSYSVSPSLPVGLILNYDTGIISGTPTATSSLSTYTVTAANSGGDTTFDLVITVNNISPSSLAYTSPNVYNKDVTISPLIPTITGDDTTYSISSMLPTGLLLSTSTGIISGTPTATSSSNTYTVTATNSGGNTTFDLVIAVDDIISYTLSYLADTNGFITGTRHQSVVSGSDGTQVTATPNTGYHFIKWSDNVLDVNRKEINVIANLSVTALFAADVLENNYSAPLSLPAAIGSGLSDESISMNESRSIGPLTNSGTNILAYINSQANFQAPESSNNNQLASHSLSISNLNLATNIITLTIASTPQTLTLQKGETKLIDLDDDGINDIKVTFADVYVNRAELTVKALDGVAPLITSDSASNTEAVIKEELSLSTKANIALIKRLAGRILLQVETKGQAWYLDKISLERYYLADGLSAYQALRKFGLGITNNDLNKIPVAPTSALPSDYVKSTGYLNALTNRLAGRIVLQVENHGEAWYINPVDGYRYYLANGAAAYQIMRNLSLGITDANLHAITVGQW